MATNYVQEGRVIDYTNAGSAITSGAVVVIGALLGVALVDIGTGETGAVQVSGVFTVPKTAGAAIGQGESLTWDVSVGSFDDNAATPAAGDITGPAAVAFNDPGDADTTMQVLLTGVPGTVN